MCQAALVRYWDFIRRFWDIRVALVAKWGYLARQLGQAASPPCGSSRREARGAQVTRRSPLRLCRQQRAHREARASTKWLSPIHGDLAELGQVDPCLRAIRCLPRCSKALKWDMGTTASALPGLAER
jgi:hypothetical protein